MGDEQWSDLQRVTINVAGFSIILCFLAFSWHFLQEDLHSAHINAAAAFVLHLSTAHYNPICIAVVYYYDKNNATVIKASLFFVGRASSFRFRSPR